MDWLKERPVRKRVLKPSVNKKSILTVQRNVSLMPRPNTQWCQQDLNLCVFWGGCSFFNVAAVGKFEPQGFMFQEKIYWKSRGGLFLKLAFTDLKEAKTSINLLLLIERALYCTISGWVSWRLDKDKFSTISAKSIKLHNSFVFWKKRSNWNKCPTLTSAG